MAAKILWIFQILSAISGSLFIDAKGNICGNKHLVQERGSINSPNYPHPYPDATNCSWTILSPPSAVLTLIVKDIDIEDDQGCISPPCCNNNVLILPQNDSTFTKKICGHNLTIKPIQVSHLETKIIFQTTRNKVKSRGFSLSYNIENFNSGLCEPDQAICNSNSKHCFSPSLERCDGIFNCPNGEDEVGCGISSHPVHLSNNCMSPSLWCDGNFICDGNNHQETCLKNSVISATIMGCLFSGLMLVIAMMCGLRLYTMHSESSGYRFHLPAHIATRLSLTRYVSFPELIEDDFFHREPPPSYSIAVGQTSANVESISTNRGHRNRSWRQRSLTPIKPPTPTPSSETSNQSSPSRDSITSSSYLSNDENVQLVNPEV